MNATRTDILSTFSRMSDIGIESINVPVDVYKYYLYMLHDLLEFQSSVTTRNIIAGIEIKIAQPNNR